MISNGFTALQTHMKVQGDEIPEFKVGQDVAVKSVEMIEGKTSPPGYLTESDLLSLVRIECWLTAFSLIDFIARDMCLVARETWGAMFWRFCA